MQEVKCWRKQVGHIAKKDPANPTEPMKGLAGFSYHMDAREETGIFGYLSYRLLPQFSIAYLCSRENDWP